MTAGQLSLPGLEYFCLFVRVKTTVGSVATASQSQLRIASLLVAQWSERWCTNLGAQGSIPGMSRSESAITRGKTQMMLLPPTSFS
jgi:hypothetical protein